MRSLARRLSPRRRTLAVTGACTLGVVVLLALMLVTKVDSAALSVLAAGLIAVAAVAVVDDRLRVASQRVQHRVDDLRARQSRLESRQGHTLTEVRREVGVLRGDVEALVDPSPQVDARVTFTGASTGPRVLMVTSNGSGMGHVVRCLAVGRELASRGSYAVLTLSTAHDAVRRAGFPVSYFPSPDTTVWKRDTWHRAFASYLRAVLEQNEIDMVVFDGTAVYRGLTESCRVARVPLVWMRRGLWKKDMSRSQRDAPLTVCDHVIVPGDLGEPEPADGQHGSWITRVGPVTLASRSDLLPPREAREELGLDPDGRYALVSVGRARLGGEPAGVAVVGAVRDQRPGVTPVVLVPPTLEGEQLPEGVRGIVGRFPLAPLLSAFELAVCAAGYNAVHEAIAAGLPTLFVPWLEAAADDQAARARAVDAAGLGVALRGRDDLVAALGRLAALSDSPLPRPDLAGAVAAAEVLCRLGAAYRGDGVSTGGSLGLVDRRSELLNSKAVRLGGLLDDLAAEPETQLATKAGQRTGW